MCSRANASATRSPPGQLGVVAERLLPAERSHDADQAQVELFLPPPVGVNRRAARARARNRLDRRPPSFRQPGPVQREIPARSQQAGPAPGYAQSSRIVRPSRWLPRLPIFQSPCRNVVGRPVIRAVTTPGSSWTSPWLSATARRPARQRRPARRSSANGRAPAQVGALRRCCPGRRTAPAGPSWSGPDRRRHPHHAADRAASPSMNPACCLPDTGVSPGSTSSAATSRITMVSTGSPSEGSTCMATTVWSILRWTPVHDSGLPHHVRAVHAVAGNPHDPIRPTAELLDEIALPVHDDPLIDSARTGIGRLHPIPRRRPGQQVLC